MIFKPKIILLLCVVSWLICPRAFAEEGTPGNFKNPIAVQEVLTGKRAVANAAWWGFDKDDSTAALQGAIDSGASKVIVPYMGSDWIVRPINLASNQEIVFEPGVVVLAKKNEFKKKNDCLFRANDKSNITLRGYGATFKMRKKDYLKPTYTASQSRMALALYGCENVNVFGLSLKESGGDGIYLGTWGKQPCRNISIKDCICDDNYRQGISVISVEKLRIDNCIFKNTSGHRPSAGIDMEPNYNYNKLSNIVVSNCISENNEGQGFVVSLRNLTASSADISILFVGCYVTGCKGGVQISSNSEEGPNGLVEFRDSVFEDARSNAIFVETKTRSFNLRFTNCKIKNACPVKFYTSADHQRYNVPVILRISRQKRSELSGDIEFNNCYLYDTKDRPAVDIWPYEHSSGLLNIKGTLYIQNKFTEKLGSGLGPEPVDLQIKALPLE